MMRAIKIDIPDSTHMTPAVGVLLSYFSNTVVRVKFDCVTGSRLQGMWKSLVTIV